MIGHNRLLKKWLGCEGEQPAAERGMCRRTGALLQFLVDCFWNQKLINTRTMKTLACALEAAAYEPLQAIPRIKINSESSKSELGKSEQNRSRVPDAIAGKRIWLSG